MKVAALSGGVGGARMVRGFAALDKVDLTVIVNVGDDETIQGFHVSADLDTVTYTLGGVEGPEGWGRAKETFATNTELERFGLDNRFQLGDLDLALHIFRTLELRGGASLSSTTRKISEAFGISPLVLPATDDRLRTRIQIEDGSWISFQEYFVIRQHRDRVLGLKFEGKDEATPAPGVVEAIRRADIVVIGPSNPPLSIWPILAIEEIRQAVHDHDKVIAVSPLIKGQAIKGPTVAVMDSLGLPPGTAGVVHAYRGLLEHLVVGRGESRKELEGSSKPRIHVEDTYIPDRSTAKALAKRILTI